MKPIIAIILRIIIILPSMKYIYIYIGEIERVNRPFNFQILLFDRGYKLIVRR